MSSDTFFTDLCDSIFPDKNCELIACIPDKDTIWKDCENYKFRKEKRVSPSGKETDVIVMYIFDNDSLYDRIPSTEVTK